MTQKFFVDASGNYLGSFDGGSAGDYWNGTAWGAAPSGVTAVAGAPAVAGQKWNGAAWVDTTASLGAKAQAAYAAAIAAGLAITSTGTPAISGIYGVAQQDQLNLMGLQVAIVSSVTPPSSYTDSTGTKRTLTTAQITAIATAVFAYVAALDQWFAAIDGGGTATQPAPTATIG